MIGVVQVCAKRLGGPSVRTTAWNHGVSISPFSLIGAFLFPLTVTDASSCRSISKKNGSMGNLLGCSATGERLVTAARDGDVLEAQKLMELNPGLARYSTFAGLNTPLHAAAAGGHTEIVIILLENGGDVNARNVCGQTPLMEACSGGRWEVVQTLILFRCNVSKVEFLSGRTALHFAAAGGHTRCIMLLAADFSHSSSLHAEASASKKLREGNLHNSPMMNLCNDSNALTRFIDKAANGGITPLHLAALSGHSDCVHLLLDLRASVAATTLSYANGAGSTPLHYAASGGSLKCCQILLARGASRSIMNCNGWLPVDVARIWGSRWLIPLLTPHSPGLVPAFPPSNYLPLPLMNILQIARVYGLHSSTPLCDNDVCAVCLERTCTVAAEGCGHELCTRCALSLCSISSFSSEISAPAGSIPCPLCRNGIVSFKRLPTTPENAIKPSQETILLYNKCGSRLHGQNPFSTACGSELCTNKFAVAALSSWRHPHMADAISPLACQNQ